MKYDIKNTIIQYEDFNGGIKNLLILKTYPNNKKCELTNPIVTYSPLPYEQAIKSHEKKIKEKNQEYYKRLFENIIWIFK